MQQMRSCFTPASIACVDEFLDRIGGLTWSGGVVSGGQKQLVLQVRFEEAKNYHF